MSRRGAAGPQASEKQRDAGVTVQLRVTPRAARNAIKRDGDLLRVHVTASPVDGAANAALIRLLASRLRVPASTIHIVSGQAGRTKLLHMDTLSAEDFWQRVTST